MTKKTKPTKDMVVNIKIYDKEQIITNYSYDDDKLNKDLCEFIISKTKKINFSENIKLNFFNYTKLEKKEIKSTIHKHFEEEYKNARDELKKSNFFVMVMFVLGMITFSILIACYNVFNNFYLEMIIEIAALFFIDDALDTFVVERTNLQVKCLQMQKISCAEINIFYAK